MQLVGKWKPRSTRRKRTELTIGGKVARKHGVLHLGDGSFTWICGVRFFGLAYMQQYGIVCKSNEHALYLVANGLVRYAIVAIDNGTAGAVTDTANELYEMFTTPGRYTVNIFGAIDLAVDFAAFSLRERRLEDLGDITHCFGHVHGLAQCDSFMTEYMPQAQRISKSSNVAGLDEMQDKQDEKVICLAPLEAQDIYGGFVIADKVQKNRNNRTRMLIVEPGYLKRRPDEVILPDARASMESELITIPDELRREILQHLSSGCKISRNSLRVALHCLADQITIPTQQDHQTIILYRLKNRAMAQALVDIDLGIEEISNSRIFLQSHDLSEYAFLMITIEGHEYDPRVQAAIAQLRTHCEHLAVVGSYAAPKPGEHYRPV